MGAQPRFTSESRPRIVPTFYGFLYLLFVITLFAFGVNKREGTYHAVGLTLIICGFISMIQSNENLKGIRIATVSIEPGEEQKTARWSVALENATKEPRYNLVVKAPRGLSFVEHPVVPLLNSKWVVELMVRCPGRGVYSLAFLTVASRGLYGLFYSWLVLPVTEELVVYPRPEGTEPLPPLTEAGRGYFIEGEDFMGHRPYHQGASLKQVDWKVVARGGGMQLKDFRNQGDGLVVLRYQDVRAVGHAERLRQLSSWVFQCAAMHRPFTLELGSQGLQAGEGALHLNHALRLLAACEAA